MVLVACLGAPAKGSDKGDVERDIRTFASRLKTASVTSALFLLIGMISIRGLLST